MTRTEHLARNLKSWLNTASVLRDLDGIDDDGLLAMGAIETREDALRA